MRAILLIVLACVSGYWVLQIDKIDPDNYVKMYLGSYVVEMNVLGFILLVVVFVLALYFFLWLIRLVWKAPKTYSKWQHRRHRDKSDEQLGAGYLSLIKGDWRQAEKQLTAEAKYSHVPYVNYLAAARAAQEQGRYSQRDAYLENAYTMAPKERLAIGLTKARLHQKAGQLDQAQSTLDDLSDLGQKNPQYTAMLAQTYQQANDWQALQTLLPAVKKQKALPNELIDELQASIYLDALHNADDIHAAWKMLPRAERKKTENVAIYARSLVAHNDSAAAEKIIRKMLKHDWSDELVDVYGCLSVAKPEKLQRRVEGWLMARPENAHASLAAGRLALAGGFYEEAKQHLQSAISNGPIGAAYAVLGAVFEANNENSKALQAYRAGMKSLESAKLKTQTRNSLTSNVKSNAAPVSIANQQERVKASNETVSKSD